MENQIEVMEQIGMALENVSEEGTTLKDVIMGALPNVDVSSLKEFFSFIVDKKAVKDWETRVFNGQDIRIVPNFAGGY